MSELATCNKCGWVHFEMSRDDAQASVKSFNEYFNGLSVEEQIKYYRGKSSSIDKYETCFGCGNHYKDFRNFKQGDCPPGSTLQPIIRRDD